MSKEGALAKGVYCFEQIRNGQVIDSWTIDNILPLEGLNYFINTGLNGASQSTSWYVGVFQGNYTPVTSDTAATFQGAATECVSYSETARQTCTFATSTAATSSNTGTPAVMTFNAVVSVYGAFVASTSAKNSTLGTLLSAARFSAVKNMTVGDILQVTYAVSLTSA